MDNPPATTPDDDAVSIADTEDNEKSSELRSSVSASLFSGPIPPPALMREYAELDPEFPRRFVELFERQQSHDHEVEKAVLTINKEIILSNQEILKRGQLFGFVLALVGLIGGLVASFLGSPNGRQHNRGGRPRLFGRSFRLQQKRTLFITTSVSCISVTSTSRRRFKRNNKMIN